MASLSKQNTLDMRGLALQFQQLQDALGNTLFDVTTNTITLASGVTMAATTQSITTLTGTTLTYTTINGTNLDLGSSGVAGTLDIFPSGSAKGKTQFTCTDNTGNTTTTINTALQATTRTYTIPDAGATASFLMTAGTAATATITDLDLGTTAGSVPGTLDIFPNGAAKGKTRFTCTDNTGDTTTIITTALQAGAVTYTIPDAGASASFVMSQGAATIVGAKTFSTAMIPTGGVAAAGGFSARARLVHSGGCPPELTSSGFDATPITTEVYIGEVFVPCNMTVTGVSVFNGSNVTGNLKVGLGDSAGAVLGTSASTAGSGPDAYQRIPFTSPLAVVGPATYFILTFYDSGTARYNTHTFGDFGASKQTGQTYSTGFTTFTPPTTFTTALASMASLYSAA